MVGCGSKNEVPKNVRFIKIGLHLQNMLTSGHLSLLIILH